MTVRTLKQTLSGLGINQGDLADLLSNLVDQVNELVPMVNQLRKHVLYNSLGNPGFAISTNFDVKNANAISYTNGGTVKTLSANTNFDTGTSKTLTGAKWGAAVLSVDASGTGIVTWASGGAYATEAAAIAALPACAATETAVGYVTVLAHASGFTAGTDALTTGTGGNVATTTNYYNHINQNATQIGAAVTSTALTLSGA